MKDISRIEHRRSGVGTMQAMMSLISSDGRDDCRESDHCHEISAPPFQRLASVDWFSSKSVP